MNQKTNSPRSVYPAARLARASRMFHHGYLTLLLLCGMTSALIGPKFQCMVNEEGVVDVTYKGDNAYLTFPTESQPRNRTNQIVSVCVYSDRKPVSDQSKVSYIYHVLCRMDDSGAVKTLNVETGVPSDMSICKEPLSVQTMTTPLQNAIEVTEPITPTTAPMTSLTHQVTPTTTPMTSLTHQVTLTTTPMTNLTRPTASHTPPVMPTTASIANVTSPIISTTARMTNLTRPTASLALPLVDVTRPVPSHALINASLDRPMATLRPINSNGYVVSRVETKEMLRLRVQTFTEEDYLPPLIGKCWYTLTDGKEERAVVESDTLFLEYGCSVQNGNRLFPTNNDVFFMNGLMEKVSYPFDLMPLFDKDFTYMQITCETYFCKEEQSCRARCPPSQTTYQVSGFPLKLNLSTEIYVDFVQQTTKKIVTESSIVKISRTTDKPPVKQPAIVKVQPYLLIGTLAVTTVILLLIGLVVFRYVAKQAGDRKPREEDKDDIFHTHVPIDETSALLNSKDSQKLIENQPADPRHARRNDGFHGNHGLENMPADSKHVGQQGLLQNMQYNSKQIIGNPGNQKLLTSYCLDPQQAAAYESNHRFLEHLGCNLQPNRVYPSNQMNQHHGNVSHIDPFSSQQHPSSPTKMNHHHGNILHIDQLPRQHPSSPTKIVASPSHHVSSSMPGFITRTPWRSPEGVINYGFEGDRGVLQTPHNGNRRSEVKTPKNHRHLHSDRFSPVGGEIYQGRPVKDRRSSGNMRPHRSDTALLNDALREYFETHGMLN